MGARPTDFVSQLLRLPRDERERRLTEAGDPDEVLTKLADQADRWVIDDLPRALDATAMLVELADTSGAETTRARARRAQAQALAYANRFDDALRTLAESVKLAESAGDESSAVQARLAMVHALARLGRYDDAIEAGQAAYESFSRSGQAVWAAKAAANLGVVHRMKDDPAAALAHFERARPALQSDPVSLAQLDSNRADALLELNRFAEAESAFNAALEAFEQAGMSRGAAIVEGNLADLMSRQGRLERALHFFERVRGRFEADGAEGDLARLEAEQAEAFAAAGMREQAAESYAAALPRLERHGMALDAARARMGLGRVQAQMRRYDEAHAALSAAHEAFSKLENAAGVARVRLRQGELALARGESEQAGELLEEALRLLEGRPAEAAVARQHLAAMALASSDLDRAERLLEAAVATARQAALTPLLADLLHGRAKLRLAQQRPDLAREDLRAAVAAVERVRGSLQADRLRSAFVESRTAVYEDLVAALLDSDESDRTAQAFATVEQAKSRALLDLVAGAVASATLLPESAGNGSAARLVQQVVAARGELNALYSRIVEPDAAVTAGWTQEVEACERRLQTLESRLAVARGLGGLFAAPVDLASAQRLLDPDTALLEYFIAGEEVLAFVVGRETVAVFRHLVSRAVLADHVELTRFQIERAVSYDAGQVLADARLLADAQRELGDLHTFLVEPLAEALEGVKRLVVVPHGPLHAIPFHALFDGKRYLIESFEMTYAPSASLMRHLERGGLAASQRGARGLILGVADDAAPRIEAEVRAVAASLPSAKTFVGPEATWARLSREAPTADLVHLACHGRFTPHRPLSSGVKLGDRWMTVRDLYELKLDGAVVVLSGCDTGRTVVGGGDDLVGLVRGFFAAGASALLMTLWPLHDETAEILVASIYKLWQNRGKEAGAAPNLAAAVQTAQRRLLQAHPHPVFWAPFVLVGGR